MVSLRRTEEVFPGEIFKLLSWSLGALLSTRRSSKVSLEPPPLQEE